MCISMAKGYTNAWTKPQSLLTPQIKIIVLLQGLGAKVAQKRELLMLCVLLCACAPVNFKHFMHRKQAQANRELRRMVCFFLKPFDSCPLLVGLTLIGSQLSAHRKAIWHTPGQDRMKVTEECTWDIAIDICTGLNQNPVCLGPHSPPWHFFLIFFKNYIPFFVMLCVYVRTHMHALTCTHTCMLWHMNILKLALSFHMWSNSGWSNSCCQILMASVFICWVLVARITDFVVSKSRNKSI